MMSEIVSFLVHQPITRKSPGEEKTTSLEDMLLEAAHTGETDG